MARRTRVIIVGGGMAGLTLALCLERAGIEFVLLEAGNNATNATKRNERNKQHNTSNNAYQVGAGVVIWGGAMRILDQLKITTTLANVGHVITHGRYMYGDGSVISEGDLLDQVAKLTGYSMYGLAREEFLQVLYDSLGDKSTCFSNARVSTIVEDKSGVEVTTTNGISYYSEIVVGADGVHSRIRQLMLERAAISCAPVKPEFYSEYTCVFGIAEHLDKLQRGTVYNVNSNGQSLMVIVGKETYFVLYEYQPIVYSPHIPRFTREDAMPSMKAMSHLPLVNGLTAGDLFAKQRIVGKVSLEEGTCPTLFNGRCCIIGDALHKMTPNDGFGGIIAMESAVWLANELNQVKDMKQWDAHTVHTVLQNYSDKHKQRAQQAVVDSGRNSRLQAGYNVVYKVLRATLFAYLPLSALALIFAYRHKPCPIIDFLPKPMHSGTLVYHNI